MKPAIPNFKLSLDHPAFKSVAISVPDDRPACITLDFTCRILKENHRNYDVFKHTFDKYDPQMSSHITATPIGSKNVSYAFTLPLRPDENAPDKTHAGIVLLLLSTLTIENKLPLSAENVAAIRGAFPDISMEDEKFRQIDNLLADRIKQFAARITKSDAKGWAESLQTTIKMIGKSSKADAPGMAEYISDLEKKDGILARLSTLHTRMHQARKSDVYESEANVSALEGVVAGIRGLMDESVKAEKIIINRCDMILAAVKTRRREGQAYIGDSVIRSETATQR